MKKKMSSTPKMYQCSPNYKKKFVIIKKNSNFYLVVLYYFNIFFDVPKLCINENAK